MIASKSSNKYSSLKTVKLLLECGADPNIQNKYGHTALMIASSYSNTDSNLKTVECLLEYDANPDIQCIAGKTALMKEVQRLYFNNEIVEFLLKYKADINIKDNFGFNPCNKFFKENSQTSNGIYYPYCIFCLIYILALI